MRRSNAGKMRHLVNVMRPAAPVTDRGQQRGQPLCVRREVPCSIETISGTEDTEARRQMPTATYSVELYHDPSKPILELDYLTGGTLGDRVFNIGHVADPDFKGLKLTLLCSEKK